VTRPLMILVAGPYRSGTGDDPARLAANVRAMNEAAPALATLSCASAAPPRAPTGWSRKPAPRASSSTPASPASPPRDHGVTTG
jgi:hypothetical protein